jgi:hypothetical protein
LTADRGFLALVRALDRNLSSASIAPLPENRKGEKVSKKHAMERIVGELRGQKSNRQGI